MHFEAKDTATGVIFILIALFFGIGAWSSLPMGTAREMGPGYFPLVLSSLLALIGLYVARPRRRRGTVAAFGPVPWRAILLILSAPLVFGLLVRGLGFIPSVAVVCLMSAFASTRIGFRFALLLSVALVLFCTALFIYGLQLNLPLFGPWLGA